MEVLMRWRVYVAMLCVLALIAMYPSYAQLDGALPIPVLRNVQVNASASYETTQDTYQYHYTVTNPAANTGTIIMFYVDIRSAGPAYGDANALVINFRGRSSTFQEEIASLKNAPSMVPVGVSSTTGWDGSIWGP